MTFEIPDSRAIDVEALKKQMHAFFNVVVSTPSILKKNRIDDFDLLIGSTAVHHGLKIITHNSKHFERIPDIQIEDWETS